MPTAATVEADDAAYHVGMPGELAIPARHL